MKKIQREWLQHNTLLAAMSRFSGSLIALLLVLSSLFAAGGAGAAALGGQDLAAIHGPEPVELHGYPAAPGTAQWGRGEERVGSGSGFFPPTAPAGHARPSPVGARMYAPGARVSPGCRPMAERLPYDANAPPAPRKG
jgi:hypothetical protein